MSRYLKRAHFDSLLLLITGFCFILSYGCTSSGDSQNPEEEPEIPDHIKQLENLSVYSPDEQSYDTVELVKEQVFESNMDVVISGTISELTIDDKDRVFIVGFQPGTAGIYANTED